MNSRIKRYLTCFMLTFFLYTSCEEGAIEPVVCITGPENTVVGEMVEFDFCRTDAELLSIWTGDSLKVYSLRDDTLMVDSRGRLLNNLGRDVTGKTSLEYSYQKPGNFTVTLVGTNTGNNGNDIIVKTAEMVISVSQTE